MRRSLSLCAQPSLISISEATFFRTHPSAAPDASKNPPLFKNLSLEVPSTPWRTRTRTKTRKDGGEQRTNNHWAVISAKGGTTFLEVLRGSHFCQPLNARTYPYLSTDDIPEQQRSLRLPSQAIQYVGFNPGKGNSSLGAGVTGAYLSARYESKRLTAEETDWTVRQYLKGQTEQNPSHNQQDLVDDASLYKVVADLRLQKLLDMPVSNLSNGQTRRARIAKALLGKPLLLLLDDPFMGLDPPTLVRLSPMLRDLARASSPLLLLALRPQDPIPDWITHLVVLGNDHSVSIMGPKAQVLLTQHAWSRFHGHFGQPTVGKDSVVAQMAHQMTKAYGPPLQGLDEILTENGVYQYDTYQRMRESEGIYVSNGMLKPRNVPADVVSRFREARSIGKGTLRSLEDLLVLTTTPPIQLQEFENASVRATRDAAVSNSEMTSIKPGLGDSLIELQSVVIKYGDKVVLGHGPPQVGYEAPGLNITIREGTRLALLGPNGSGKTTFLSLLTSDHPQSYSLPIKFFGRSRLPEPGKPGLSMWEIQSRVGHSSPEVHSFFPKTLNIRQVLESAWAETYISKPKLSHARDEMVNAFLRWWEPELRQDWSNSFDIPTEAKEYTGPASAGIRNLVESVYPPLINAQRRWAQSGDDDEQCTPMDNLDWAEDDSMHRFGVLPFGTQRLLLLLRALIKQPDVLILDEAFSGLSSKVRDKAMCFMEDGETKVLFDQPDLDFVRFGMETLPTPEVEPRDNARLIVQRLVNRYGMDLDKVIRNRNIRDSYAVLRNKTKEQLVEESLQMTEKEHGDGSLDNPPGLQDYKFEGLTNKQAMVVVSHIKEEVPETCDEFVRLPGEDEVTEDGRGVEMGYVGRGGVNKRWAWVWRSRKP